MAEGEWSKGRFGAAAARAGAEAERWFGCRGGRAAATARRQPPAVPGVLVPNAGRGLHAERGGGRGREDFVRLPAAAATTAAAAAAERPRVEIYQCDVARGGRRPPHPRGGGAPLPGERARSKTRAR